jgi:hypothetical protein
MRRLRKSGRKVRQVEGGIRKLDAGPHTALRLRRHYTSCHRKPFHVERSKYLSSQLRQLCGLLGSCQVLSGRWVALLYRLCSVRFPPTERHRVTNAATSTPHTPTLTPSTRTRSQSITIWPNLFLEIRNGRYKDILETSLHGLEIHSDNQP